MNPFLLGFLSLARTKPVFVLGHDVLAPARGRDSRQVMRRTANLGAEAKAIGERICWGEEGSIPVAMKARECLEHREEMEFCFRQLIPFLRCVATENEAQETCPHEVKAMLASLEEQARQLQPLISPSPVQPIEPNTLANMLGAPCQITGNQVIPLEPANAATTVREAIVLNSRRFVPRREKARPLSEVVRSIEQEVRSRLCAGPTNGQLDGRMARLVATAEELITFHRPVRCERCRVVYQDRFHQLQYSRAQFCLVRGPIRRRSDNHSVFVGVRVRGPTRLSILSARPHRAGTASAFWTPRQTPVEGGVCMGQTWQYRRLRSTLFTDAEALIVFLDAAVAIASGRSLFHRARRGRSEPRIREAVRAILRRHLDECPSRDATRSLV